MAAADPDVRISAALIVRNEEKFIAGCLDSIAGRVDEIVIVDTGSTDETLNIIKRYDVVLLYREWRDDFAWARNEGLAAATGDWILYIDADERLILPEGVPLNSGLDVPGAMAARVRFRPRLNVTPFREHRLIRNDPRLRFRGAMHETFMTALSELVLENGAQIVDSPAEILHLGYEGDQSHKHARNLPLLRAAIAREPRRLYYWHHLVMTLEAIGANDEATATAAEAAKRIATTSLTPPELPVASLLLCSYARLLHQRGEDAMPAIEAGLSYFPAHAFLKLVKAQVLIDRNDPAAALPILEDLAATDSATFADDTMSHDNRVFDLWSHDLMGVALLRLGRRAEAAAAFARAAEAAPDDPSYRVKAMAIWPAAAGPRAP